MQVSTVSPSATENDIGDCSEILHQYDLAFTEADQYYLQVGEIQRPQGWILHVSAVGSQLIQLLTILVPVLKKENVSFKVVKDIDMATLLLEGQLTSARVGKLLRIYPDNDQAASALAQQLIALTRPFRGPAIPTDAHLGGTVYTRYGSFNPVLKNTTGQVERFIYNGNGELVRDDEAIPFQMPHGVAWPYAGIAIPAPVKSNKVLTILHDKYLITSVLKADVKGSVYKGYRLKGLMIQPCIIKEAKHDMFLDEADRDMTERLRWQYRLQKDLRSDLPVPEPYDLFEENGDTYLVMEFVKGVSFYDVIMTTYNNGCWLALSGPKKLLLINYLLQLLDHLNKLHQRGYVHRDFTPVNFLLDKRDRFSMIDMELS